MSNPGHRHRNKVNIRCRAWLDALGIQLANPVANWPARPYSWDSAPLAVSLEIPCHAKLFYTSDRYGVYGFPTLVAVWRFGLRLEMVIVLVISAWSVCISHVAPRSPLFLPCFGRLPVLCACRWVSRNYESRFDLFYRRIFPRLTWQVGCSRLNTSSRVSVVQMYLASREYRAGK